MSHTTPTLSHVAGNFMDGKSNFLKAATVLIVALITYSYYYVRASKSEGIHRLPGLSLLHAWTFFSQRNAFLLSNLSKHKFFQFNVLQHNVVAVSGEEARKLVFSNPSLDGPEGYKILFGGVPRVADVDLKEPVNRHAGDTAWFNKQLLKLLHKDRLQDCLSTLFDDLNRRINTWGPSGQGETLRIDPFEDVYGLVLQMTCRMMTCKSLSDDIAAVQNLGRLYMTIQKSTTPVTLLLPGLPSRAKRINKEATTELYTMLTGYIQERRKDVQTTDAIDIFVADGQSDPEIIGWIFGALFAGVLNTGIAACWILISLDTHPEWKQKVRAEISGLVDKYLGPNVFGTPVHERLASIPLGAWDDETPILEACIRETIRVYLSGTLLRRNFASNLQLENNLIGKGAFMAYHSDDIHMDSTLYPNPTEFNPGRFLNRDPEIDSKITFPYIGWGAGRHPCTGMRFAKLEIKIVTALVSSVFDYKLVDRNGKHPETLPTPDRADVHQARPKKPCYLNLKRHANIKM